MKGNMTLKKKVRFGYTFSLVSRIGKGNGKIKE